LTDWVERVITFITADSDTLDDDERTEIVRTLREMRAKADKLDDLESVLQTCEAALTAEAGRVVHWRRIAENLESPALFLKPIDDEAKNGLAILMLNEAGEWGVVRYNDENPEYPWEEGDGGERWREDMAVGYVPLPLLKDLLWREK
jgi:hypothetical protein